MKAEPPVVIAGLTPGRHKVCFNVMPIAILTGRVSLNVPFESRVDSSIFHILASFLSWRSVVG